MSPIVYLVSGANRGIGLGIVAALAKRDNVVVFAGARNPASATDLQKLVEQFPGKIHVVKLTSSDKEDNVKAVEEIKRLAGRLDVVIANAGISQYFGLTVDTPIEQVRDHFEVNTVGVLVLFQTTYPLLKESTPTPKFIAVSSGAGSIEEGAAMPISMVAYGASKAALNYVIRKLHHEHPELITFPISPGGVATDMTEFAQKSDKAFENFPLITVDESVKGVLNEVDNGTRETSGGQFVDYTGTRWKW